MAAQRCPATQAGLGGVVEVGRERGAGPAAHAARWRIVAQPDLRSTGAEGPAKGAQRQVLHVFPPTARDLVFDAAGVRGSRELFSLLSTTSGLNSSWPPREGSSRTAQGLGMRTDFAEAEG